MLGRRHPHIKLPIAHGHHPLQRLFQHIVRRDLFICDAIPISLVLLDQFVPSENLQCLDHIKIAAIKVLRVEYQTIGLATWREAKRCLC